MMMIKRAFFILLVLLTPAIGRAQNKDFGIWYSVNAELKLIQKIELDLSPNVRTFQNGSRIEEAFLDVGLTYKVLKNLSLSAFYRITENLEDDNSYHPQHKLFFDIKGSYSPGDLSLSGRIRYQRRYKTYIEDAEDEIPDSHARLKLKAQYDIPSFKFNPYVSTELFFPMFKDVGKTIDKKRFMAGFEYSFSKKHSIEAGYLFQRDYFPDLSDIHVISINYNLKF
jgi:hypothetical protein